MKADAEGNAISTSKSMISRSQVPHSLLKQHLTPVPKLRLTQMNINAHNKYKMCTTHILDMGEAKRGGWAFEHARSVVIPNYQNPSHGFIAGFIV